ncbi:6-pyruvoyl-tetrahydropterin synthase-related protein [Thermococcus sp.]|uniref:6-pyruvoyl-tetrahydropterin synthase-related protein n=1 Tax=Thermococcus sp. TaxID=35749 RepID=UPI00260FF417|nr:6-pyruvoyl-tetrahydropterin synthase-related protein [Thermococcus sp.]
MRKRDIAYIILLSAISVILFLPLFSLNQPPALSVDGNGHLFKIHKLMTAGWKPWIEDWYAGFPFLRFYPPASYLLAASLGKLFGADIRGYAATLMLTSIVGALALWVYLGKTGKERYAAPVLFLLFPWHIGVAYLEGNFPRANAIALSPLFLLSALWLTDHRRRYLFAASLGISIVVLTHHSIIIPLTLTTLVLLWDELKEVDALSNSVKAAGLVTVLTSFWYVPFFMDIRWTNFWNIYTDVWLFRGYSIRPEYFLQPAGLASLLILSLVILDGVLRRNIGWRKPALLLVFIYLSLGVYSPTPWIHSIPPLSMIPPYRWMDMANLLVPLMVSDLLTGMALRWKYVTASFLILILIIGIVLTPVETIHYPRDLIEVSDFLKEQSGSDWRFVMYPLIGEAFYSYMPALCGKATMNGWYHEGNPVGKGEWTMWYLLDTGGNATPYLKAYAVRFFVTSLNTSLWGYHPVERIGNYTVYESNVSFIQRVNFILVGKFYEMPLDYAYIENPSELELLPPGAAGVIYVGQPSGKFEKILREFTERGGTVLWIPETSGDLFGIRAEMAPINGFALSSRVYNVSHFAPFSYEGGPWYGPVFKMGKPIVKAGNEILIGEVRIGRGRLYLIGGNLLFHALYWNSSYELGLLVSLAGNTGKFKYIGGNVSDGMYRARFEANGPTLLRVSEAYYPYWHIEVNGREARVLRDDRTGLTLVPVNGSGEIEGEFRDPFLPMRMYSTIAWLIISLYVLFEFFPGKRVKIKKVKTP